MLQRGGTERGATTITLRQRFWSGLINVPWALILLMANLTPLAFYPPQTRGWLHQTLLTSKVFALSGDRPPASVSFGLRIWDTVNAYFIIVAAASVPALSIGLVWWLLDLQQFWALTQTGLTDKASVAQVVAAAFIGGIAIDVFLLTQLSQLLRPRVHACFLKSDLVESNIRAYFEEYVGEETLDAGKRACLHLRITNTGTGHLTKLDVRMDLPIPFQLAMRTPPGANVGPEEMDRYSVRPEDHRLYFSLRDDPLDTAPGASAVHHVFVVVPSVERETTYPLYLRIASEKANGFTQKKLRLRVIPASSG